MWVALGFWRSCCASLRLADWCCRCFWGSGELVWDLLGICQFFLGPVWACPGFLPIRLRLSLPLFDLRWANWRCKLERVAPCVSGQRLAFSGWVLCLSFWRLWSSYPLAPKEHMLPFFFLIVAHRAARVVPFGTLPNPGSSSPVKPLDPGFNGHGNGSGRNSIPTSMGLVGILVLRSPKQIPIVGMDCLVHAHRKGCDRTRRSVVQK